MHRARRGASPIRTLLIDVGAYRPIGATIAGITMLAALDDEEVEAILRRTAAAMARHRNATPDYVRRQIANVRRNGFCVSKAVLIEGTTGISAAGAEPGGAALSGGQPVGDLGACSRGRA